jgi:hypothetical protein
MQRVVYLLGAGFSAPLGLPLIGNFIDKAKDQFEADGSTFSHFQAVFDTIRDVAYSGRTYNLDLSNIEEVLSVLEMQGFVGKESREELLTRFISDVIKYHTPPLEHPIFGNSWAGNLLPGDNWAGYALLGLMCSGYELLRDGSDIAERKGYQLQPVDHPQFEYSFVTLNYDLVLEKAFEYLTNAFGVSLTLARPTGSTEFDPRRPPLAKLHGSVDSGTIVPPTWSKGASGGKVAAEWALAYRLLSEAHHIRIIGYSLPEGDAYVRYLLRAAAVKSFFLKQIDVICLDQRGTEKARYKDFVTFPNFRFSPKPVQAMFNHMLSSQSGGNWPNRISPELIERAHASLF